MYLGRVIGCVWATIKDPSLEGQRFLVVQPLTPDLQKTGKQLICTDSLGAGTGQIVYWVRGKEASFPFHPGEPVTDTTIVGLVDSIHLQAKPALPVAPLAASAPPAPAAPGGRAAARKR